MPRRVDPPIAVFVYGAGKVGRSLARALRQRGAKTTLRAARRGLPRSMKGEVVILAVRDEDIRAVAESLARERTVPRRAVVLHVAGALDAAPLAPLRGLCAGVGQMHPMLSFASMRFSPDVAGGSVHIQGDRAAVTRARRVARLLRMRPWTIRRLDATLYHAAAGLVANGGAALAAVGAELLTRAGVPARVAPKLLGPLLRSVAENVQGLGFPDALTGPVRRGDVRGVQRHLTVLRAKLPKAVRLYLASVEAQLPLARAIGDARAARFDDIERLIHRRTRRV
jgi:predicted short-subunit dehydrogenase-like oxidoreductase (DUF2520 family)